MCAEMCVLFEDLWYQWLDECTIFCRQEILLAFWEQKSAFRVRSHKTVSVNLTQVNEDCNYVYKHTPISRYSFLNLHKILSLYTKKPITHDRREEINQPQNTNIHKQPLCFIFPIQPTKRLSTVNLRLQQRRQQTALAGLQRHGLQCLAQISYCMSDYFIQQGRGSA